MPSEEIFFKSYQKVANKFFGENITTDDYKKFELEKNEKLFDMLSQNETKINKKKFMEKVYEMYESDISRLLENDRTLINFHALEILKKRGIRLGMVTTSKRSYVDKILNRLGASNLFEKIIAREDVNNHKPDSEGYKSILDSMNLKPEECLAIEDSIRGIHSAKNLGINCIAVHRDSLSEKEDIKKMDVLVLENVIQLVLLYVYGDMFE